MPNANIYHLCLPARMDTPSIQELHQQWLNTIPSGVDVVVDASALSSLYTAAAQMLVSLATTLAESGHTLSITQCSASIREDITHLGLSNYLLSDVQREHSHA